MHAKYACKIPHANVEFMAMNDNLKSKDLSLRGVKPYFVSEGGL